MTIARDDEVPSMGLMPARFLSPVIRVASVITFHEKAGRSQGDWVWYLLGTLFLSSRVATVATPPIPTLR